MLTLTKLLQAERVSRKQLEAEDGGTATILSRDCSIATRSVAAGLRRF